MIQVASEGYRHLEAVSSAIKEISAEKFLELSSEIFNFLKSGNQLFVGGNGGSLFIAEHICTDWTKGIFLGTSFKPKIMSLNSVAPLQTAISNDLGYENSLSFNVEMFARPGDAVLLISSSGNSPNILRAAQIAKSNSCQVLALSGFGASKLCELADFYITLDSEDYQVIEDVHAILGHAIFKFLLSSLK